VERVAQPEPRLPNQLRALPQANLSGAILRRAQLRGAIQEANLEGAKLNEAFLYEADFRWADLCRASLHDADLEGANLHKANLRHDGLAVAAAVRRIEHRAARQGQGVAPVARDELPRADGDTSMQQIHEHASAARLSPRACGCPDPPQR
jgi:Pentapeptide repeats (8 copies)